MYKTRLNNIKGKSETVSINIDVEIFWTITLNHKGNKSEIKNYENKPKNNINDVDEHRIPYKKVIKQKLLHDKFNVNVNDSDSDDDIFITIRTEKTYGPFTVNKPVNLSATDTYKFAMYTLLKQGFNILSRESIVAIGCKIIKYNKKQFKHHKMGKLKLKSYLLNKQRTITSHGANTCVIDYVWDQVRGVKGFKVQLTPQTFFS